MPEKVKQILKNKKSHCRQKANGSFEYRIMIDGVCFSACAMSKEEAKKRFLKKLREYDDSTSGVKIPTNFQEFSTYYFENFRIRAVAPKTYKNDMNRYKRYIKPAIGKYPIKSITPLMCQNILDELHDKGKTLDEIHSLMNLIFKAAIKHGIIKTNPLDLIFHRQHEREHGTALTREEEEKLLSATAGTVYQTIFAVALYCGLRPNEYKTAVIVDGVIEANNSKRKNGKVETKRIPITPKLAPFLEGITEIESRSENLLREKFKSILPNHTLKDMRMTFYTRCITCRVEDKARDYFVGHGVSFLEKTYTDKNLLLEYLKEEAQKIKY